MSAAFVRWPRSGRHYCATLCPVSLIPCPISNSQKLVFIPESGSLRCNLQLMEDTPCAQAARERTTPTCGDGFKASTDNATLQTMIFINSHQKNASFLPCQQLNCLGCPFSFSFPSEHSLILRGRNEIKTAENDATKHSLALVKGMKKRTFHIDIYISCVLSPIFMTAQGIVMFLFSLTCYCMKQQQVCFIFMPWHLQSSQMRRD